MRDWGGMVRWTIKGQRIHSQDNHRLVDTYPTLAPTKVCTMCGRKCTKNNRNCTVCFSFAYTTKTTSKPQNDDSSTTEKVQSKLKPSSFTMKLTGAHKLLPVQEYHTTDTIIALLVRAQTKSWLSRH